MCLCGFTFLCNVLIFSHLFLKRLRRMCKWVGGRFEGDKLKREKWSTVDKVKKASPCTGSCAERCTEAELSHWHKSTFWNMALMVVLQLVISSSCWFSLCCWLVCELLSGLHFVWHERNKKVTISPHDSRKKKKKEGYGRVRLTAEAVCSLVLLNK